MMDRLAIDGGERGIQPGAYRRWPDITDVDERAMLGALRDERRGVSTGVTSDFEHDFAAYCGREHALAMPTGTAACHASLVGAGVRPGDEVVVPAFSFVATGTTVVAAGAIPVFVDVVPDTWCIDYEQAEQAITDRTRAIFAVHMDGTPADMGAAQRVHRECGVPTVEDAAHAAGTSMAGKRAGSFGITAAFSLHREKVLTCIAGGIVVCDDDEAFHAIQLHANFGEERSPLAPGEERSYWARYMGTNYRLAPQLAALARAQLGYGDGARPARLDRYVETAQRNAAILDEGLRSLPGWSPPVVPDGCWSSYCHYRPLLDPRAHSWDGDPAEHKDRILAALIAEGVDAITWQRNPLPAMPVFRRDGYPVYSPGMDEPSIRAWARERFPVALDVCARSLVLCSGRHMLHVQDAVLMHRIVEACDKVEKHIDRVLSGPYVPPKIRPSFPTAEL